MRSSARQRLLCAVHICLFLTLKCSLLSLFKPIYSTYLVYNTLPSLVKSKPTPIITVSLAYPHPIMAASTATKLTLTSTLPLPKSSFKIPRLGFGVYKSPPSVCVASCLTAIRAGYRHIDTAQYYDNEAEVGSALSQSPVPRSELFITTKILSPAGSVDASYKKCLDSVEKIHPGKEGYVDLFLIHTASSGEKGRREMWEALERLHAEGKARAIGVSNFGIGHIEEMRTWESTTVWPPHANQIELHPFCQQRKIVEYCHKQGIVVEAYSPLVRNQKADDKTLVEVAARLGVSTQQLLIRYCLQKGWVPLPKSDTEERIKKNADVYGFEIGDGDMKTLDGLDEGEKGAIVMVAKN